jgi:hypothetical protein
MGRKVPMGQASLPVMRVLVPPGSIRKAILLPA